MARPWKIAHDSWMACHDHKSLSRTAQLCFFLIKKSNDQKHKKMLRTETMLKQQNIIPSGSDSKAEVAAVENKLQRFGIDFSKHSYSNLKDT